MYAKAKSIRNISPLTEPKRKENIYKICILEMIKYFLFYLLFLKNRNQVFFLTKSVINIRLYSRVFFYKSCVYFVTLLADLNIYLLQRLCSVLSGIHFPIFFSRFSLFILWLVVALQCLLKACDLFLLLRAHPQKWRHTFRRQRRPI